MVPCTAVVRVVDAKGQVSEQKGSCEEIIKRLEMLKQSSFVKASSQVTSVKVFSGSHAYEYLKPDSCEATIEKIRLLIRYFLSVVPHTKAQPSRLSPKE